MVSLMEVHLEALPDTPGAARPICWTVHPARRRPGVALAVLALLAAVTVAARVALGPAQSWLAWPMMVLMLGSLSPFFLPTRYELDGAGVGIGHGLVRRRRAFSGIRRIEVDGERALLSPFPRPRRLDRFRALIVPLEGAPPAAVASLSARAAALHGAGQT